jgi:hypothetical protein
MTRLARLNYGIDHDGHLPNRFLAIAGGHFRPQTILTAAPWASQAVRLPRSQMNGS